MKYMIYINTLLFQLSAPVVLLIDNFLYPNVLDLNGIYFRFIVSYFLYVLLFVLVYQVRKKEMYPLFEKLTKKVLKNNIFRKIIIALILFTTFIVIFELLTNELLICTTIHSSTLIITVILELIIRKTN